MKPGISLLVVIDKEIRMNRIVSRKLFVGVSVPAALLAILPGVVAARAQGCRPHPPPLLTAEVRVPEKG